MASKLIRLGKEEAIKFLEELNWFSEVDKILFLNKKKSIIINTYLGKRIKITTKKVYKIINRR
ncbi:MAG: hypothetical protein ACFFDN_00845 [Candidatus Hodarchaeota archaeon]